MASGYASNGTDLDNFCEHYVSAKPISKSGYDLSDYKINGESIVNRYNKPNTDEWASSFSKLYVKGETVPICRIGRLPTQTKFAELTSAGTYNIDWDSSGLTIGSTTYPASTFRNGKVPEYIGIIIAGGGGTSSNNYVAGGAGGTATTSMGTTTAGNPYGYYKGSSTG